MRAALTTRLLPALVVAAKEVMVGCSNWTLPEVAAPEAIEAQEGAEEEGILVGLVWFGLVVVVVEAGVVAEAVAVAGLDGFVKKVFGGIDSGFLKHLDRVSANTFSFP